MRKHRVIFSMLLVLVVLGAACERPGPQSPGPSPKQSSPSPTAEATFDLEGVVQEASGSASFEQSATPSPAVSPTRRSTQSPSPTSELSPSPTVESTPTVVIERGAPGSLAIKIQRYSAGGSPCRFVENDVLVVAFTSGTDFQPSEVRDERTFPNNLKGTNVQITGRVEEEDRQCLLIATAVRVGQTDSSPAASRSPVRGRTSPTPSRAPSPSPSPTA